MKFSEEVSGYILFFWNYNKGFKLLNLGDRWWDMDFLRDFRKKDLEIIICNVWYLKFVGDNNKY